MKQQQRLNNQRQHYSTNPVTKDTNKKAW